MSETSSNKKSEVSTTVSHWREQNNNLVIVSPLKSYPHNNFSSIASSIHWRFGKGATGDVAIFLLKLAALEGVRRLSSAKCPVAWRGIQAFQVLCYPPFKWIQKWAPFKGLVRGMQALSKPLFVISIATAFSEFRNELVDDTTNHSEHVEPNLDLPSSEAEATSNTRICDEPPPRSLAPESWLLQLREELGNEGIRLPERMDEDELHHFYTAASGDFSRLLSSIKKTIRWRETYYLLSKQELDTWSNLVFWHGFDVKKRPCLFVRLGLACIRLPFHDRPRFAQALVSQIEHGILHLVNAENSKITVVVDCEGLTPLRMPMQMIKSYSTLLNDHFPNRLGCLFVIRLPSIVRVIFQTLTQVLKPNTKKKLKIENETYLAALSEYFQIIPSYLGGKCTCATCAIIKGHNIRRPRMTDETNKSDLAANSSYNVANDDDDLSSPHPSYSNDLETNVNYDHVLMMVWPLVAVIVCLYIYYSDDRLFAPP